MEVGSGAFLVWEVLRTSVLGTSVYSYTFSYNFNRSLLVCIDCTFAVGFSKPLSCGLALLPVKSMRVLILTSKEELGQCLKAHP